MSIFDVFKKKDKENESQQVQPVQNVQPYPSEEIKTLVDSLSNLSKSVKNIEGKMSEINEKVSYSEEIEKKHEDEINSLKNSIEKMFSIYDALSKQYNPFIEEETKGVNVIEEKKEEINDALPLDTIRNDPSFIAIILGWLNYLVKKSNIEEVKKALDYYESVNWITEDVKIKLLNYLKGFENIEMAGNKLTPEDHLVSLYIITKLKKNINADIKRFKELYNELIARGMISPI